MDFCLSQYYCFLQVDDLHRHKIDHFTIPSSRGPEFGVLRRVDDVRFLNQGYSAECLDLHHWALLFFSLWNSILDYHITLFWFRAHICSFKINNNQM